MGIYKTQASMEIEACFIESDCSCNHHTLTFAFFACSTPEEVLRKATT